MSDPMTSGTEVPLRVGLTEISNAVVALHREHFGRGPGAAKTHVSENLVVCVLSDVFTPPEKTLIGAGRIDQVRQTRAIHREAVEGLYVERLEALLGCPVEAHLSSVHVDPDVAVDIFVLGDGPAARGDGPAEST